MKGVNVIKKLSNDFPRHSLVTIYISFVQQHLDYELIVYEQFSNDKFRQKLKACSIMLLLQ